MNRSNPLHSNPAEIRYILGINCSGFRSSACLLKEGEIIVAVSEERLSRVKRDKSFPTKAIEYCLNAAGIKFSDISRIYVGWNPKYYIHRSDKMLNEAFKSRGKLSYLVLNELSVLMGNHIRGIEEIIQTESSNIYICFCDHHLAHLFNVYSMSGYQTSDFLVADGFGEITSGIAGYFDADGKYYILEKILFPHSLGMFYSSFTEFSGLCPECDENKFMSLAGYGDSDRYYDIVRKMVKIEGLKYELDLTYFQRYMFFKDRYFSKKMEDVLGPALERGHPPGQREFDIAAAVQRVLEESVFELLRNLHKRTGNKNLVLNGGVFMNVSMNGKISEETPYENIFIGGTPDDSGISLGSALFGYAVEEKSKPYVRSRIDHNYFGKTYDDSEIESELISRKLKFKVIESPAKTAGEYIASGKLVGWFQGASEFGQRALGNRSILADPRSRKSSDAINKFVKHRPDYQPFAPAVLKEYQNDVFYLKFQGSSYFMERCAYVRHEWRSKIPAVVHVDGTSRYQTVDDSVNLLFYKLIYSFYERTGIPLILNTSFNRNEQPIVETPADALNCFFETGLDALFIHHYLIEK